MPKLIVQVLAPVIATFVFLASFAVHYNFMRFGAKWIDFVPAGSEAREFLLRVVWSLSSSALVPVVLASIAVSLWTIQRSLPRQFTRWFAGATALVAAILVMLLRWIDLAGGAGKALIDKGEEILVERVGSPMFIDVIVEATAYLSGIAIVLLLASVCAVICGVLESPSEQRMRAAYECWTANLVVTAAFLVVGSLEIRFLYQWMAATVHADPQVVQALSLGSAILYSAVLITIFLPTSIVLELTVRRLPGAPKKKSDRKSWRVANDLSRSRLELIAKYSLMLAPAIFGAFAELPIWGVD
jgi:hypothetical protein